MRFSASQPAATTLLLAFRRFIPTQPRSATLLLAFLPCGTIQACRIPRPVGMRSLITPRATATRPTVTDALDSNITGIENTALGLVPCIAIPAATTIPPPAFKRSFPTPLAISIRPTVTLRWLKAPPATITQLPARMPSTSTTATTTQPMALRRSYSTPPASKTRPTVLTRSIATQTAFGTRPPVLMRSITTPPAFRTRPPVFKRCLATQPASATRPLV